jgi:hypothetical protein
LAGFSPRRQSPPGRFWERRFCRRSDRSTTTSPNSEPRRQKRSLSFRTCPILKELRTDINRSLSQQRDDEIKQAELSAAISANAAGLARVEDEIKALTRKP